MTLYYPNYSSSFGCGLTPDKWILANHATKRLVSSMCKRIGGTSNWNPNGCTFGWPSSIFTACFLSEERLTAFNRKRNGSEPDTTHERQAHQTDCPRHVTNTRRPPWDFGGPVEDSRFGPSRHQFRTPTVRAVHCGRVATPRSTHDSFLTVLRAIKRLSGSLRGRIRSSARFGVVS